MQFYTRTRELVGVVFCEVEHVFVGVDDLESVFEDDDDGADVEVLWTIVHWLLGRRVWLCDARAL